MKARTVLLALVAVVAVAAMVALNTADAQRGPGPGQNQRTHTPGVFDYYVVAMSWSPSYCAGLTRGGYDPQCHSRDGKRYSFVLHGLWPQYERGWPENCQTTDRGFVPREVARRMLDIMPSERLVFHQYRKHGTCSGLGIDGYFDLSRKLYGKVKIPPRYVNVNDPRLFVAPADLAKEFIDANPGLKPDAIVVKCGGPGPRLEELRVCFDKAGEYRACGRNENQARLCSAPRIYVPPVRASGGSGPRPGSPMLPGPKGERAI